MNWKKRMSKKPVPTLDPAAVAALQSSGKFRRIEADIFPDHLIIQGGYDPESFPEALPTVPELVRMVQRIKETKIPEDKLLADPRIPVLPKV